MIMNLPKHNKHSKKLIAKTLCQTLDGLIQDRYSLNEIFPFDLVEHFKDSILSTGYAFGRNEPEGEEFYDEELVNLLDEKTKSVIKSVFNGKVNLIT